MSSSGQMHTGQPGPGTSSMLAGIALRRPAMVIERSCPPQTFITLIRSGSGSSRMRASQSAAVVVMVPPGRSSARRRLARGVRVRPLGLNAGPRRLATRSARALCGDLALEPREPGGKAVAAAAAELDGGAAVAALAQRLVRASDAELGQVRQQV